MIDINKFCNWITTQYNIRGTLYLESTANTYAYSLNNLYFFNFKDIPYQTVYEINDFEEAKEIYEKCLKSPKLKQLNEKQKNGSFKNGFKLYLNYLQSKDNDKAISTSNKQATHHNSNAIKDCIVNINIEEILQAIENYHNSMSENYTRYKSWTNCYFAFKNNRKPVLDEKALEYLCLHLSVYLSSWGMLRNSKLIDFDFWVHKDFIIEIMNEKYDCFYNENFFNTDLIFEAVDLIKKCYPDSLSKTDTLITKILLGVFGCVPAYDRYFKKGISSCKIAGQNFNRKSLMNINEMYSLYENEFEKLRSKYFNEGYYYTRMKLIDMAFWQIGRDIESTEL